MTWSVKVTCSELITNVEGLNGPPPLLEGEEPTRYEWKRKSLLPQNVTNRCNEPILAMLESTPKP